MEETTTFPCSLSVQVFVLKHAVCECFVVERSNNYLIGQQLSLIIRIS